MSNYEIETTPVWGMDSSKGITMSTMTASGVKYYAYWRVNERNDKYVVLVKHTGSQKSHIRFLAGDGVLGGGSDCSYMLEPNFEYVIRPNVGRYINTTAGGTYKKSALGDLKGCVLMEADDGVQVAVIELEY